MWYRVPSLKLFSSLAGNLRTFGELHTYGSKKDATEVSVFNIKHLTLWNTNLYKISLSSKLWVTF